MATTLDCFQRVGKQPNFSDWLNNRVTDVAIEEAVALSMRAEILSGPLISFRYIKITQKLDFFL